MEFTFPWYFYTYVTWFVDLFHIFCELKYLFKLSNVLYDVS